MTTMPSAVGQLPLRAGRLARRAVRHVRYRRAGVECSVCGGRFAEFNTRSNPGNRVCPRCGLMDRHRHLWLWLQTRPDLLASGARVLHFAPEQMFAQRLQALSHLRYVSIDLSLANADVWADIEHLPFRDDVFDLVICSHVLEHVDDDREALKNLRRVMARGAHLIVMVPIDANRATTFEDPAIVTPEARRDAFWQEDHVRLYGLDIEDRFRECGFEVTAYRPKDLYDDAVIARYQLWPDEPVLLLRPA